MSIYKWILTGLGWASSGPIGALMGFLLGRIIEGVSKGSPRLGNNSYNMNSGNAQSGHHGSYRNTGTREDIDVALLVLIASVMKSDGEVRRTELDYVKQFLLKNYGEEKGKSLLAILRDLVKPETHIDLNAVCGQIKPNTDYTTRYHMVDFLFGLAVAESHPAMGEALAAAHPTVRAIHAPIPARPPLPPPTATPIKCWGLTTALPTTR